ncbi:MAG: HEAT repeat domain-containing protein [Planctomycetota bacterium]
MTHWSRPSLLPLLGSLALAPSLWAHGGQYRGPGDVPSAPSSTGSSPGGSTSASGSGAGGTGSPSSSGASGSTSGAGSAGVAGTAPRGAPLDEDFGRWEFWWEFGKDPYLRLREAVYGSGALVSAEDALLNPRFAYRRRDIQRPNEADLGNVAGSLVGTLRQARDRDTVSACLVALAKIGRDGAGWNLHQEFVPFLSSSDQEQRETAALAFGIAGRAGKPTLDLLCDLVRDGELARKACASSAVNERTRAFAAFGLGLLLQRLREPASAHQMITVLRTVLARPEAHGRNLKVAAIEALSLFPKAWAAPAANILRDGIARELGNYYDLELGPGEQLVQAHVLPALSRLLPRDADAAGKWKNRLAAELAAGLDAAGIAGSGTKVNPHVAQSCALALGELRGAWNLDTDEDAPTGELLLRVYREHRDQQTRSFALLALGRGGGSRARAALLRELANASRAIEQPWCAVALGVLAAREAEETAKAGRTPEPDVAVAEALHDTFRKARNSGALAALAISLGLCGGYAAADNLRQALAQNAHRDELAGYLCLGLGLMGDDRATGEIRALVQASSRRPVVMLQAVRALGLLGDHRVVDDLCKQLENPEPSLVRLSAIAAALGQIGDRRSLEPLGKMLGNQSLTPLTRAFAAVALGAVCDKDPLPWNAAYARHCNYRASTETLTNGSAGILDIL